MSNMQIFWCVVVPAGLVASVLLVGAVMRSTVRWWWCPRCNSYHSELGVTHDYPRSGTVIGMDMCEQCKRTKE